MKHTVIVASLAATGALLLVGSFLRPDGRKTDAVENENPYLAARKEMVEKQLTGWGRNITNERVLAVMGKVSRHEFVPAAVRDSAYADRPLPIGHGQTISQPYIVAFMTEKLEPKPAERVLEGVRQNSSI